MIHVLIVLDSHVNGCDTAISILVCWYVRRSYASRVPATAHFTDSVSKSVSWSPGPPFVQLYGVTSCGSSPKDMRSVGCQGIDEDIVLGNIKP